MINVKVKSLKHMKGYHKCKNYFFTFSLFFFSDNECGVERSKTNSLLVICINCSV